MNEDEKDLLTELTETKINANNLIPIPSQFLKENGAEVKDVVMALPEPEPTIQARKQRKFTMFWQKKKIHVKPPQAEIKPSVEIVSVPVCCLNETDFSS